LQIADFKLQIVSMTPDELKARTKKFALRILKLMPAKRAQPLLAEATELVAIFVTTRKSAASNLRFAI
jgi:hypothetical protein